MANNLIDSGTTGRFSQPPHSFSSAAYGRYTPSSRDYSSEFYSLLRRWRFETLTISSSDEILGHDAFREIVNMGDIVLPLIVGELKKRPDLLVVAMTLITGENPIRPDEVGDIAAMTESWIDWYESRT